MAGLTLPLVLGSGGLNPEDVQEAVNTFFGENPPAVGEGSIGTTELANGAATLAKVGSDVLSAENHTDGATKKVMTAAERTKLTGVAPGADVTATAEIATGTSSYAKKLTVKERFVGTIYRSVQEYGFDGVTIGDGVTRKLGDNLVSGTDDVALAKAEFGLTGAHRLIDCDGEDTYDWLALIAAKLSLEGKRAELYFERPAGATRAHYIARRPLWWGDELTGAGDGPARTWFEANYDAASGTSWLDDYRRSLLRTGGAHPIMATDDASNELVKLVVANVPLVAGQYTIPAASVQAIEDAEIDVGTRLWVVTSTAFATGQGSAAQPVDGCSPVVTAIDETTIELDRAITFSRDAGAWKAYVDGSGPGPGWSPGLGWDTITGGGFRGIKLIAKKRVLFEGSWEGFSFEDFEIHSTEGSAVVVNAFRQGKFKKGVIRSDADRALELKCFCDDVELDEVTLICAAQTLTVPAIATGDVSRRIGFKRCNSISLADHVKDGSKVPAFMIAAGGGDGTRLQNNTWWARSCSAVLQTSAGASAVTGKRDVVSLEGETVTAGSTDVSRHVRTASDVVCLADGITCVGETAIPGETIYLGSGTGGWMAGVKLPDGHGIGGPVAGRWSTVSGLFGCLAADLDDPDSYINSAEFGGASVLATDTDTIHDRTTRDGAWAERGSGGGGGSPVAALLIDFGEGLDAPDTFSLDLGEGL